MAWKPLVGAVLAGAVAAGVAAWQLNLRAIEHDAASTQAALKKLALSRGIPPNQDVMDYLTARQAALEQRLQSWLHAATAPPLAEAAAADPQLYFQEQLHDVQRMLERAATARSLPPPQQLGLPKELPPPETVPRLLVQLSLIQALAPLIFEQGVAGLASFKIEDPETLPEAEGETAFLTRVPVRVRLTSSLPQLLKILAAIERVEPMIELRAIRLAAASAPDTLESELTLARYLASPASAQTEPEPSAAVTDAPAGKRKKKR